MYSKLQEKAIATHLTRDFYEFAPNNLSQFSKKSSASLISRSFSINTFEHMQQLRDNRFRNPYASTWFKRDAIHDERVFCFNSLTDEFEQKSYKMRPICLKKDFTNHRANEPKSPLGVIIGLWLFFSPYIVFPLIGRAYSLKH